MDRIQELIRTLTDDEVRSRAKIARAKQICKICGKPATSFRMPLARFEYNVSLICQSCQDYYWCSDYYAIQGNTDGIQNQLWVDRKRVLGKGLLDGVWFKHPCMSWLSVPIQSSLWSVSKPFRMTGKPTFPRPFFYAYIGFAGPWRTKV